MNEAIEPRLELHERSEIGHAGDCSSDAITHMISIGHGSPWVRLQLLEAQRNPLLGRIHLEDQHFELLAHAEHIGRFVHAAVRNVRDVQHAVHAAHIDKCAVI